VSVAQRVDTAEVLAAEYLPTPARISTASHLARRALSLRGPSGPVGMRRVEARRELSSIETKSLSREGLYREA
jgi:hypothetical protein